MSATTLVDWKQKYNLSTRWIELDIVRVPMQKNPFDGRRGVSVAHFDEDLIEICIEEGPWKNQIQLGTLQSLKLYELSFSSMSWISSSNIYFGDVEVLPLR